MPCKRIKIIGGGLAGCEAALQLAKYNYQVDLFEMRPKKTTQAHQTPLLAELVCSNSLKSELPTTASGLLKEELRLLDCELLKTAEKTKIPAGSALAVDRTLFAREVTVRIEQEPKITIHRQEVDSLDDRPTIVASGPLTSDGLAACLQKYTGVDNLYFYDAIAPIITADSIDYDKVYFKGRYDKGGADYLNCPFSKDEYQTFVQALIQSEKFIGREFEREYFRDLKEISSIDFYENCTPIEELAYRGEDTLRFGVMRPVGLEIPETGERPYAVIQLRAENREGTMYNLVGCQTMMTQSSQRKVFRLIPGLHDAEFLRYGSIHRNTYINSPTALNKDFSLQGRDNVYIAGQLAGVEGYVESIASGLIVAQIIASNIQVLPEETILGQIWRRLASEIRDSFVPVNANFGLLPPLEVQVRDKKLRKQQLAERSLSKLHCFLHARE